MFPGHDPGKVPGDYRVRARTAQKSTCPSWVN